MRFRVKPPFSIYFRAVRTGPKIHSSTDKDAFSGATVNQMFGGCPQLPTTAERCCVLRAVLNGLIKKITALGSSQKLRGAAEHLIDGSEQRIRRPIVGRALNFRVRMG